MKKSTNLLILLAQLSGGRWTIAMISALFPVLITMGFGVVLAFQHGYILHLSLAIAVSTLAVTVPLYLLSRSLPKEESAQPTDGDEKIAPVEQELVSPPEDWSQREVQLWHKTRAYAYQLLEQNDAWGDIDTLSLETVAFVSERYGKKALDFSVPEGLKLFEEVSRRYNKTVKEFIPAVELIKVSHIKAGYEAYDNYGELGKKLVQSAIWINHAKNIYFNPLKFVTDVSKQQVTSSMTKGLIDEIQLKSKHALLDEVAAVAIDLYSGRFRFEDEDIEASQVADEDIQNSAKELEPIRIVITGQTGAGKSSLVNLLLNQTTAEVDTLPSTDGVTAYRFELRDKEITLVDTAGLDGTQRASDAALQQMTQADLVLWALRANQPAKALDIKLYQSFTEFYEQRENVSRREPELLGVVTQIDKLVGDSTWQPPYDLNDQTDPVSQLIDQAVEHNRNLMNNIAALPLALSNNGEESFGLDALRAALQERFGRMSQVQRNRQRVEATQKNTPLKQQAKRVGKTAKAFAKQVKWWR